MKNKKVIINLAITFLLVIALICVWLCGESDHNYVLYIGVVLLISILSLVINIFNNKDEFSIYNSKLKNYLRTYDAVLSKVDSVPKIGKRNVIIVNSMESMINAQVEIRKPIYYFIEEECCVFILLDVKDALFYIFRRSENVVSSLDEMLEKMVNREENDTKVGDGQLLDNIDKTTIIKLSNRKSFKVSPIRKKGEEVSVVSEESAHKEEIVGDNSNLDIKEESNEEVATPNNHKRRRRRRRRKNKSEESNS